MPKIITERIIDRRFKTPKLLTESQIVSLISSGGASANPAMSISPDTNVSATGFVGGTFSGSQEYTLTNTGAVDLVWSATKNRDFTTLSSSGGTLAVGADTTMTVSIDGTAAAALNKGEYIDLVIFNITAA